MKIKMHKYFKVALAASAVLIPLFNIVACTARPRWSIGGEICILPFALMIAGYFRGKDDEE